MYGRHIAFVFPAHSACGKLLEIGLSGRTYTRNTRAGKEDGEYV
jgi:hypothetical protein